MWKHERREKQAMEKEVDRYIDGIGGDWGKDFRYFRLVAKAYSENLYTEHPYAQAAKQTGSSYSAVQQGAGRAAKKLWETGQDTLKRDLGRPGMTYPGPLALARWIARVVTQNFADW